MFSIHYPCDRKLDLLCLSFPRRDNHEMTENGDCRKNSSLDNALISALFPNRASTFADIYRNSLSDSLYT